MTPRFTRKELERLIRNAERFGTLEDVMHWTLELNQLNSKN